MFNAFPEKFLNHAFDKILVSRLTIEVGFVLFDRKLDIQKKKTLFFVLYFFFFAVYLLTTFVFVVQFYQRDYP